MANTPRSSAHGNNAALKHTPTLHVPQHAFHAQRFLVLPFSRTLDAPPARHTEHVARPLVSIADDRSLLADAVHCRHGSKLMAVPRGVLGLTAMPPRPVGRLMRPPTRTRAKRGPRRGSMCGGDRAPSAPVFAAVEADARRIAKWAARCPARCGTRRSVRGEPLPSRA